MSMGHEGGTTRDASDTHGHTPKQKNETGMCMETLETIKTQIEHMLGRCFLTSPAQRGCALHTAGTNRCKWGCALHDAPALLSQPHPTLDMGGEGVVGWGAIGGGGRGARVILT